MFKRQETDLRRLLAMLLIPACLLCAGCGGAVVNAAEGAGGEQARIHSVEALHRLGRFCWTGTGGACSPRSRSYWESCSCI